MENLTIPFAQTRSSTLHRPTSSSTYYLHHTPWPVENTDTKLLIYGLFQKGRVLAHDGLLDGAPFSRLDCDEDFDVSAYENSIRDKLAQRLEVLEPGLQLIDVEYPLPNQMGTKGFIDILASTRPEACKGLRKKEKSQI